MSTFIVQLSARSGFFNRLTDTLATTHTSTYLTILHSLQAFHSGHQTYATTKFLITQQILPFDNLSLSGIDEILVQMESLRLNNKVRIVVMKVRIREMLGECNEDVYRELERVVEEYERGEIEGGGAARMIGRVLNGFPRVMRAMGGFDVVF